MATAELWVANQSKPNAKHRITHFRILKPENQFKGHGIRLAREKLRVGGCVREWAGEESRVSTREFPDAAVVSW